MERLSQTELSHALTKLPNWHLGSNQKKIIRHFKFKGFNQAFGFLTQVALLAEKYNHHPIIENNYSKVIIRLTTHDCKGISKLDIKLAQAIDALL